MLIRLRSRLRSQNGFGVLELLIAMTVMNIGILTLVAAFQSSAVAIKRASRISTASVLADSQMELYRALTYSAIALDAGALTSANADSTYAGDSAWSSSQVTATCSGSPLPNECQPTRTVAGADHNSYRVDTYIVEQTPTNGRAVRLVTVVVRDSSSLTTTYAREASTFDLSTG